MTLNDIHNRYLHYKQFESNNNNDDEDEDEDEEDNTELISNARKPKYA